MDLMALLKATVQKNASDLHLKVGRPPLFRVSGDLMPEESHPPLTQQEMEKALFAIMSPQMVERFKNELEADIAYDIEDLARFRINLFQQRGKLGAVCRRIPLDIPNMEDLGLPTVLKELALRKQGWVLVAGPTGSGKSTTMASMVEYINRNRACHIVTIEDPVEFIYTDKKSTINQRQLGSDTLSLDEALKRVLRQDPDVILMGEMRDAKTMEIAMHAAETGHLVFATIHTNDAKQTLDRVMDSFPAERAQQIRQLFSLTLAGILAQKLIRRRSSDGMVVAVEVLINSPHMSQLLADNKVSEITDALQKGSDYYQMQSFNQDLARLISEGVISAEEGLSNSPNPADLKLMLRGVGSGSSNIRQMQKDDQEDGPGRNAATHGGNGDAASFAENAGDGESAAAKPRKPLANTKGFTF